jgi:hypothetical protein
MSAPSSYVLVRREDLPETFVETPSADDIYETFRPMRKHELKEHRRNNSWIWYIARKVTSIFAPKPVPQVAPVDDLL